MSGDRSILFLSYDGLLDPLGGSQIIPYLREIARSEGRIMVLSFEKPTRFAQGADALHASLAQDGIAWTPLRFTTGGGPLGKIWDLAKMYGTALALALRHRVTVVHARGHTAAQVAHFVKLITGAQYIFDFRGLWVDERVDKGGWDLRRPFHRWQYDHFKRTERKLLARADQIVVLTDKVAPEVRRIGELPETSLTVIPCCADFDLFEIASPEQRQLARDALGIPADATTLGYLGSIGKMYMVDRVLRLFVLAAQADDNTYALIVTRDGDAAQYLIAEHVPPELQSRIRVRGADRAEVPNLIGAMDVLVSLIQPSYARMGASPTKMAECFAAGVPVICNAGVGDVDEQVRALDAGQVIDPGSETELAAAAALLPEIAKHGGDRLRTAARKILGLELAATRYREVYSRLDKRTC